jgi:hypothetical protein
MSNRRAISACDRVSGPPKCAVPVLPVAFAAGRLAARVPARDLIWLAVAQRTQPLSSVNVMQYLFLRLLGGDEI